MQTITHNAAALAAQAEPCLSHTVLQCQDDTESIRTVLRAYRGVGALLARSSDIRANLSGDELAELLRTLTTAMDARLVNLDSKVNTVNKALRKREQAGSIGSSAPHLAFETVDQLGHLRFGRDAFAAMHSLAPYAEQAEADDLSAALHILGENMAARLQIMDDQLDALHAAVVDSEVSAATATATATHDAAAAAVPTTAPTITPSAQTAVVL